MIFRIQMKEETLQIVTKVKHKIDQIASEKALLKGQLVELNQYIAKLKSEVFEKDSALQALSQELNTIKMSQPLVREEDSKEDLKLKVEEMIKEIDKCITLLNN